MKISMENQVKILFQKRHQDKQKQKIERMNMAVLKENTENQPNQRTKKTEIEFLCFTQTVLMNTHGLHSVGLFPRTQKNGNTLCLWH